MSVIQIATAFNIDIEFELAEFHKRFLAYMIDLFIIFIYLIFLFRSIRIFRKCPFAFGAFLALGLSFTLVIQAIANMAVNVNLFPVTGVTLPLVSMGGSSFLFTCLAIGIILSVARNAENAEAPSNSPVAVE